MLYAVIARPAVFGGRVKKFDAEQGASCAGRAAKWSKCRGGVAAALRRRAAGEFRAPTLFVGRSGGGGGFDLAGDCGTASACRLTGTTGAGAEESTEKQRAELRGAVEKLGQRVAKNWRSGEGVRRSCEESRSGIRDAFSGAYDDGAAELHSVGSRRQVRSLGADSKFRWNGDGARQRAGNSGVGNHDSHHFAGRRLWATAEYRLWCGSGADFESGGRAGESVSGRARMTCATISTVR